MVHGPIPLGRDVLVPCRASEVRVAKVSAGEIRMGQDCAGEVHASEVRVDEVRAAASRPVRPTGALMLAGLPLLTLHDSYKPDSRFYDDGRSEL
jgi:hypothetical protein